MTPRFLAISVFLLFFQSYSSAQELKVYKLSKRDADKFIIKKPIAANKGSKIKVYNSRNKLKALAKIEKCNKKLCLAKVYKKAKNFKLKTKLRISLTPHKVKFKNKPFTKKYKKQEVTSKERAILVGIGGPPVSFGYNLGYRDCSLLKNYCVETKLGFVDTSLGDVLVSGISFGIGLQKHIHNLGPLKSYIGLEAGLMQSQLDFSNIDSNNYIVDENILFLSAAYRLAYSLSDKISIYSSLGYALNTFKKIYESSSDTYEIGFSSGLLILDLGLVYRF